MKVFISCGNRYQALTTKSSNKTKNLGKEIVKAGIYKGLYSFSLYYQNELLKDGTLESEGIEEGSLIVARPSLSSSIDIQFRMPENGDTLIFEVFPFDTISSIKRKFFDKSNLDSDKNLLLLDGKVLNSLENEEIHDIMFRESDVVFVADEPTDLPENTIMAFVTLGNDLLMQLWMKKDNNINDLKEKIASVYNIPAENQDIYFDSCLQDNEKTIEAYAEDQNYASFKLKLTGNLQVTIIHESKEITQSFDANLTIGDIKKELFKPNKIKKDSKLAFEGIICNDLDALFSFDRLSPKFTVEGTVDQDALDRINNIVKAKAEEEDPSYSYIYAKDLYYGIIIEQDKSEAAKYFKKAAELKHYSAMTDYAELMFMGNLPEKKEGTALKYAKEAADHDHIGAQYLYGTMCFKQKKYEDAQKYFTKASDKGHVIASTALAYMNMKGKTKKADESSTSELLEKASKQKYVPAMILLSKFVRKNNKNNESHKLLQEAVDLNSPKGCYLLAKESVIDNENLEEAAKIAKKGVDLKDTKSKRLLGILKRRGTGVDKDEKEAFKLLTEASNEGDAQAKYHLAKMYLTGTEACKKDEQKAFELVSESADKGHPPAVLLKSNMLLRGIGTKKKPKDAYKCCTQFAKKTGDIPCIRFLGVCEFTGIGTDKDLDSASRNLLRASETDTIAQYYYGMLLKGLPRYPQNRDEVARYLSMAADKNHHEAEEQYGLLLLERNLPKNDEDENSESDDDDDDFDYNKFKPQNLIDDDTYEENKHKAMKYFARAADVGKIESMYQEGHLLLEYNEDEEKAIKLIKKTAETNHPWGMYEFSNLLEEGRGVDKDLTKSDQYLVKAADLDVPPAQYKLGMKLYKEGKVSEAISYLRKAADAGNVDAMVDLAKILMKEDEESNFDDILKLLKRASRLGNIEATILCGDVLFRHNKHGDAYKMYKKAAFKNNTEAMFKFARMNEEGQGTQKDPTIAAQYYKKCVDKDYIPAYYYLGRCYQNGNGVNQDYDEAVRLYQRSADGGSADGMVGIGRLYKYGLGVDDDEDKAFEYFTKAAEMNHVEGHYELGLMYEEGQGTDVDKKKAYDHFKYASDHGCAPAMVYHAHDLLHGIAVEKDMDEGKKVLMKAVDLEQRDAYFEYAELLDYEGKKDKAGEYYQKCADLGNVQGMICKAFELVKKYEESVGDKKVTPEELQENELLRKAAYYFNLASDQGDPIGCCNYGLLLAKGAGVTKDEKMAIKYMRKGVSSNFTEAIYDCGVFLDKAKGEDRSIDESRRLLKLASDAGHINATYNLGISYVENEPKDTEKGLELIKKAADSGITDACSNYAFYKFSEKINEAEDDRKEIDTSDYENDEDFKEAAEYAKKGADAGNVDATSLYGTMLVNGLGVTRNEEEAANYFQKAADQGNADSMYNYGMMLINGIGIEKDAKKAAKYLIDALKNGRQDVEPILWQHQIKFDE